MVSISATMYSSGSVAGLRAVQALSNGGEGVTKQTKTQKEIVGRVMHEFKDGELERGRGGKVHNPKQAIAIALSEAGASNQQSPKENQRRLAETKRKEKIGQPANASPDTGPNRAELYKLATRKAIVGRSRMSKADLQKALNASG